MTADYIAKLTRAGLDMSPAKSVLKFDGKTYRGAKIDGRTSKKYRQEGFAPEYMFTWQGVRDDFKDGLPASGAILDVDGERLKTDPSNSMNVDAAGGMVSIHLLSIQG